MDITIISNIGFILLAVWMIVMGVVTLLPIGHPVLRVFMGILAIAAGVFILLGR